VKCLHVVVNTPLAFIPRGRCQFGISFELCEEEQGLKWSQFDATCGCQLSLACEWTMLRSDGLQHTMETYLVGRLNSLQSDKEKKRNKRTRVW